MKSRFARIHGLLELKLGQLIKSFNSRSMVSGGCDVFVE